MPVHLARPPDAGSVLLALNMAFDTLEKWANVFDPVTGRTIDGASINDHSVTLAKLASSFADAPPGTEMAYTEITSPVSVTATSEGTANTVVTVASPSFDGARKARFEFYAPYVANAGGPTNEVWFALYEATGAVGLMGTVSQLSVGQIDGPVMAAREYVPPSGSRNYSIRAYTGAGGTTMTAGAGPGGSGNYMPAFLRIVAV